MVHDLPPEVRRAKTLRGLATAMGIPAWEIDDAEADGTLGLLIVEQTVVGEAPAFTYAELAERSGLGDEARRYWRALGFPDPAEDERVYTQRDLEALELLGTMLRLGLLEDDVALQLARVIGSAMQRVAQSQIDAIEARIDDEGPADDRYGGGEALAVERARLLLPTVPRMLEYTWRRHLQSAARRRMVREHLVAHDDGSTGAPVRAIGFADVVNVVTLSQDVDHLTRAGVVHRVEPLA
jgi:adenylate cyclase